MSLPLQNITMKVSESLSALTNPTEATRASRGIAHVKLLAYERALGVPPIDSGDFEARIDAVTAAAELAVSQALPQFVSETQIAAATPEEQNDYASVLRAALDKVSRLSSIVNEETFMIPQPVLAAATIQGAYVRLPDNRTGFRAHPAYLFLVEASKGTVLEELKGLLREKVLDRMVNDVADTADLNQPLMDTQVALFLDSNGKARDWRRGSTFAKTTQEEDLAASGYTFASDLAAILLCARICRKAFLAAGRYRSRLRFYDYPRYQEERYKTALSHLSKGEQKLYAQLVYGRVVRSCSRAVGLGKKLDDLRSYPEQGAACESWALGSPRSPR